MADSTITQGTGSNPLNPFNWFQDTPDNTAYTTGQFAPPSTDYGSLWNTAWNQGYNNYGNSTNPYEGQSGGGYDIGQGYTLGQQAYKANMPASPPPGGTPTGTVSQPSGSYSFNMGDFPNYAGWDPNAAQADWKAKGSPAPGGTSGGGGTDPYAGVRNDINSGYDAYFQNLNNQLNGLPGQADSQNQIAQNSYNMGVGDLGLQQTQGQQQLDQYRTDIGNNQNKNLKSLDENLRNMFMAGNVYLGSRGAGDSSAASQYSYALTKQGNQARGNQMTASTEALSKVQAQETNLKNIVNNETNKLKADFDNKKLAIGQWFQDAQNQVKTAIANGQLSKSTDLANLSKEILNQAMTALQTVQANATNQQNSLISWAESNSKNINELKTNLQGITGNQPTLANASTFNGSPTTVDAQGNINFQGLGTGTETKKKGLFG
jgi:hypothetical protein